jgi:hypothetical protein
MDAVELGRRLARDHAESDVGFDPADSLLNFAESARAGGWSLRSSLVRLAQPEPEIVGSLLEVVRRLDAPLQHISRQLQRHIVGSEAPSGSPDVRTADLARLVAEGAAADQLIAGYHEVAPLDDEERLAVPLLALAVEFDHLADVLAAWATDADDEPPKRQVEETSDRVRRRMDELGVPEERWDGPPGRGSRQRPTQSGGRQ